MRATSSCSAIGRGTTLCWFDTRGDSESEKEMERWCDGDDDEVDDDGRADDRRDNDIKRKVKFSSVEDTHMRAAFEQQRHHERMAVSCGVRRIRRNRRPQNLHNSTKARVFFFIISWNSHDVLDVERNEFGILLYHIVDAVFDDDSVFTKYELEALLRLVGLTSTELW